MCIGGVVAESILNALLFKSKPELPSLPEIDIGAEQQKAIASNIKAQPGAQKLAAAENLFNFDQIQAMLEKAIPLYQQLKQQTSGNIMSLLKGEIPSDVSGAIQRSDAAKALTGGYAGSTMHGSLLARDLGKTSLALTEEGITAAERWIQSAANTVPRIADASSMFITPQQQLAFASSERNTRFNYEWFKNQYDAQPEPWERAVGGLLDWIATTGENIAGSYAGQLGSGGTPGQSGGMGGGGKGGGNVNPHGVTWNTDENGIDWFGTK